MEIHKSLLYNVLREVRTDEELKDFTDTQVLEMLDGFFRAAHIFHEEKEDVKFPYLFTSVYDEVKQERKSAVIDLANKEIDKIIKNKGSISKKEMIEEIKNAGYKFRHIKPIN